ncbi:hypothetical protein [Neisseria sp. Ec49-e6-T10]|uniref:hypothetical protein n=1 Tax=Neisseria sp. Ec49-e6-T10 TaxID=3140744 RepID=UPI003EC01F62
MFYKLKRIYFTVSRSVNRGIDILIYIWRAFLSVLLAIKKTLDAIGYAIVWSLGIFILIVKYSLSFFSVIGILGGLIAMLLGFEEASFRLAIIGAISFVFLLLVWVGPSLFSVRYYEY